jgi:hypothetical protein
MLARSWLLPIFTMLGACNMVISEAPMFAESDRANITPRDGIWLAKVGDCDFDASEPEAKWPECAAWVVVRNGGRELLVRDGKRQTQRVDSLIAAGSPLIIQGRWVDDAKEDGAIYYVFYGLELKEIAAGAAASATTWAVQCGVQNSSGSVTQPYPGISAECRPSSKDAIRWAAVASRTGEMTALRWLRAEAE